MAYASLAYPLQVCKNCYQSVMNIVRASHSITFNVKKSVCILFKCTVNKHCDNSTVFLSGNQIDFVQEVEYLGVLLNPSMKTSIDVSRQTLIFYAQANMLLRNFRYYSNEVKCSLFKSFCTNMYCCPLWFNSTSSSVKKLKCSYNSVLRRLLCLIHVVQVQCL